MRFQGFVFYICCWSPKGFRDLVKLGVSSFAAGNAHHVVGGVSLEAFRLR